MERKSFELIAKIIRELKPNIPADPRYAGQVHQWERTAFLFAVEMREQNVPFNRKRFLKACGVPD